MAVGWPGVAIEHRILQPEISGRHEGDEGHEGETEGNVVVLVGQAKLVVSDEGIAVMMAVLTGVEDEPVRDFIV